MRSLPCAGGSGERPCAKDKAEYAAGIALGGDLEPPAMDPPPCVIGIERVLQRLGIREVVVGTVRDRLYGRIGC